MSSIYELSDFSREELYSVINQLKRRINYLDTDLLRFQLLSNCFQKYFHYFNEINETIESNEEVLDLKNRIKVLKEGQKSCFVSLNDLNGNCLQRNVSKTTLEIIKTSTQTQNSEQSIQKDVFESVNVWTQTQNNESQRSVESIDISTQTQSSLSESTPQESIQSNTTPVISESGHQLSADEVSDNDSEGIDCDINDSNEDTVDGSVDEISEQIVGKTQKLSVLSENPIKNQINEKSESSENTITEDFVKNEIPSEDNPEVVPNGSQIQIQNVKSLRTFRKRKQNSFGAQIDDNVIQFEDNSDNDSDYELNGEQRSDSSEDEFNNEPKSGENPKQKTEEVLSGTVVKYKPKPKANNQEKGLPFRCDHENCGKYFKTKDRLNQHNNKHLGKYVCDWKDCGFAAECVSQLRDHRMRHSGPQFKCTVEGCDKLFKDENILRYHQLTLHSELFEDIPWITCSESDCNFRTKLQNKLNKHIKCFHNSAAIEERKRKKFFCDWPGCGQGFAERSRLKVHMTDVHSSAPSYPCEREGCDAVLTTKQRWRIHMNQHKGTYRCDFQGCSYVAPFGITLAKHKLTHSERKGIPCLIDDCGKELRNEETLKRHQLAVHPDHFEDLPWLECPQNGCDYKTKSSTSLYKHRMERHSGPHICSECSETFNCPRTFKRHMAAHKGKPLTTVACEWYGCERTFRTTSLMKNHMNGHTLEKTYTCVWPACGKTFALKGSLQNHMYRHEGRARYNCPHCDYGSTNPIRYKNHMKRHENNAIISEKSKEPVLPSSATTQEGGGADESPPNRARARPKRAKQTDT